MLERKESFSLWRKDAAHKSIVRYRDGTNEEHARFLESNATLFVLLQNKEDIRTEAEAKNDAINHYLLLSMSFCP